VEPNAKRMMAARKFMVNVIFGIDDSHLVDVMPEGRSFDSEYFLEHVMQPLTHKFYPGGRNPDDLPIHVHLDNCRVHYSKLAHAFFDHNAIVRVPQPTYSPDLAISNFWLFGDMKRSHR
jgi:hypothetical protein